MVKEGTKKKNPKLIALLAILVSIIWGLIIAKIFSFKNNDSFVIKTAMQGNHEQIKEVKVKSKYELTIDYPDPFFCKNSKKNIYKQQYKENIQNKISDTRKLYLKNKKSRIPKKEEYQPKVKYLGILSNTNKMKQIILLEVDGKSNIMEKGQVLNNICIKDVYSDSVLIKINNIEQYLKKISTK